MVGDHVTQAGTGLVHTAQDMVKMTTLSAKNMV